ncbi:MAG TPA: hypothetical protein V6C57_04850 [Coleofasciculaceae cyanobacterium]
MQNSWLEAQHPIPLSDSVENRPTSNRSKRAIALNESDRSGHRTILLRRLRSGTDASQRRSA